MADYARNWISTVTHHTQVNFPCHNSHEWDHIGKMLIQTESQFLPSLLLSSFCSLAPPSILLLEEALTMCSTGRLRLLLLLLTQPPLCSRSEMSHHCSQMMCFPPEIVSPLKEGKSLFLNDSFIKPIAKYCNEWGGDLWKLLVSFERVHRGAWEHCFSRAPWQESHFSTSDSSSQGCDCDLGFRCQCCGEGHES